MVASFPEEYIEKDRWGGEIRDPIPDPDGVIQGLQALPESSEFAGCDRADDFEFVPPRFLNHLADPRLSSEVLHQGTTMAG